MNLSFLTKRYDTVGGTERDLYELTRRLAEYGHEVHIYCYEHRREPAGGVHLHRVPVTGRGRTAKLWSLAQRGPRMAEAGGHDLVMAYARVLRQDIIRCGGSTHASYLEQMGKAESSGRRLVRRMDPFHRSMLHIERRQYSPGRYRRILAVSERVRHDLRNAYDVPESAIEVIYDGIDTARFHPRHTATERQVVRARHGIPSEAPLLLFVGNAFKRKGLDTLLQAMTAVENPEAHLLVVGEDRQAGRYRDAAASLGLREEICFAGSREDMHAYYAAADILVLPALQEAFGNVVLEAMASGLPAVVSSLAGASEVVEGSLRSFLLEDPQDHEALGHHLDRLIRMDDRTELCDTARRTAERFTLDANARATEDFFQRVLSAKRS